MRRHRSTQKMGSGCIQLVPLSPTNSEEDERDELLVAELQQQLEVITSQSSVRISDTTR